MRNISNKMRSLMIIALMFLFLSVSVSVCEATTTGSLTALDKNKVFFGSYPQREVVGEASQSGVYGKTWGTTSKTTNDCYIVNLELYNKLKNLGNEKWDSNGNTIIDGNKYKRINGSELWFWDGYFDDNDAAYYHWENSKSYHYFKYEPIEWDVLHMSNSNALLLSEMIIDVEKYDPVDSEPITWKESTIRSWLNSYGGDFNLQGESYIGAGFYDVAFNEEEKEKIEVTEVVNNDNIQYGTDGGSDTNDKIFLLSEDEVSGSKAEIYGFNASSTVCDDARQKKGTTYARAKVLQIDTDSNYSGNSDWWLRSPGREDGVLDVVIPNGKIYDYGISFYDYGVLPALNINLNDTDTKWGEKTISDFSLSLDVTSYTGSEIQPNVAIEGLTEDKDFEVSYENNINAGTAKVIVNGKGDWDGKITKTFTINPQDISTKEATLLTNQYVCKDNAEERDEKKPDVTVEGLNPEVDYTVEYSDNINPGTATVTIKGKGNYTGEIVKTFRIGFALAGTVELSQTSYIYDGSEKKPKVTLTGYTEGIDFEVSYLNFVEVGTATVTVMGIGNYVGTLTETFNIERGNLENAKIEFASDHYAYYDTAVTPEVVVKIGDIVISSDNYTESYSNNNSSGTGTVTVNSKANGICIGSTSKEFVIDSLTKVSAKSSTCKDFGNTEYYKCSCGKYYSDKFGTNEIAEDSWIVNKTEHDYEDVELQPATVDADGYKKYEKCSVCGAEKNKVVIPKIDTTSITLTQTSFIVDGTEHEPEISAIKDVDENELNPNTDYEISYEDNKYEGIGKAIITFKGNYSGTVTREFAINKTDTTGMRVELPEDECTYDGEEQKPDVTVYDADDNEIASSNYEVTYENNVDAGDATVTVKFVGDYYKGTLVSSFTILRAQHILNVDQTEIKVQAKKTAQINATGDGEIVYSTANKNIATVSSTGLVKGIKVGTTTVIALIVGDKNHISVTKSIDVIVPTVITKAVLTKTAYTYNGDVQKPGIKTVNGSTKLIKDVDYTVTYKNNAGEACENPTDAGTYKVSITGIGKYDGTVTLSYTIAQAAKTITADSSAITAYVTKAQPTITATTNDETAVSYKLNNTKYANISVEEGTCTIIPKKAGSATLTISAPASKNYKASTKTIKITIKDPVNINSSKVTTIGKAVWNGGEAVHPTVTVKSGKTTYKEDTDYVVQYIPINGENAWDVGDKVIVSVDAEYGDKLACKGTYTSKPIEIVRATQPATATAPSTIYYGEGKEPVQIDIDNIPSTEGDSDPTITYKSSSTKIATVSDDGKITPIKAGKVTITVNIGETTHYAAKTIKLTVNVKAAIKLASKNVKITAAYNDGENVVPKVTVTGFKEGTDYTVEYNYTKLYEVQEGEEGGEGEESPQQVAKAIAIDDPIDVTVKAVAASGGCLGTYTATVKVGKGEQSITINSQPTTVKVKATTPTFTINGVKEAAKVDVTTKTYAKIEKLGTDQEGNYQFAITGVKKGTATVTVKIAATSKYNAKTVTFKVKVTK